MKNISTPSPINQGGDNVNGDVNVLELCLGEQLTPQEDALRKQEARDRYALIRNGWRYVAERNAWTKDVWE